MKLPIHPAGWPFIAAAVGLNVLFFALESWLGLLFLPVTVWTVAFFRDPDRRPPPGGNLILSPADGLLLPIVRAAPPPELGLGPEPKLRLSIFMSIFNVHVNRNACDGTVTGLAYRPGKFFNASFDKASLYNERMSIRIEAGGEDGTRRDIAVVQIAGLIARRIWCGLREGQHVCRGDRFGLIRFGSRVEVYLPPDAHVLVRDGQKVRAGETILAEFPV
ncbi:MAG TPA: phosphatidylserine decarboxylase [Rhizomicrobium sp.]|jgi:phosphatidylserine decarboxylase